MPDTPDGITAGSGTLLAFDFGLRRIGVAVGQSVTASASPLGVIANGETGPDHARIAALIEEWRPTRLVVGLPKYTDGTPSGLQKAAEKFAGELARYAVPVDMVDERYTSREAEAGLRDARRAGRRRRIRKQDVDAAAAVLIAERYLNL